MRRMILGAALLWIAVPLAAAQEEPPTEAPPSYAPPPAYQQPVPEGQSRTSAQPASPSAAVAPSSENEIQVIAPSGGTSSGSAGESQEAESAAQPASGGKSVPETYGIQSGDTLWDICHKLLDNPWYWPKLWSLNEYITNPHLIYPGNRLVFFPGSETAPPKLEVVTDAGAQAGTTMPAPGVGAAMAAPAAPGVAGAPESVGQPGTAIEIKLRNLSFVSEKQLKEAGTVTHSGEPKAQLTTDDHAFLEFKRKGQVSVGDRFSVVKIVKKVKNPDRGPGNLGWLVRKVAVLKVIAIHKNTVEALVTDCEDVFTRGAKFIPFSSPIRRVRPHPMTQEVAGRIVDAENQQYMISQSDFVYVNLGKKQGVDDGAQLFAVRRGDAAFLGEDKNLPDVIFGHLLIVDAGENVSTAYVTDSTDSLTIGDRVRSRVE
ncbi:MAG: LysM peptidoglycan-binding domain-containing protein [Pseudomonadota bacterium]